MLFLICYDFCAVIIANTMPVYWILSSSKICAGKNSAFACKQSFAINFFGSKFLLASKDLFTFRASGFAKIAILFNMQWFTSLGQLIIELFLQCLTCLYDAESGRIFFLIVFLFFLLVVLFLIFFFFSFNNLSSLFYWVLSFDFFLTATVASCNAIDYNY